MKITKSILLASLLVLLVSSNVIAADDEEKAKTLAVPELKSFVTKHSGVFGGKKLNYLATVSNMHLTNDKGEIIADAVTTAYTVAGAKGNRPVTFVFNGGPGSSSVWLHMGLVGPKRVVVPSDAKDAGVAPYSIVDNHYSPLDVTDIVMIDPIGTGFSVLAGKGKAEDVWSVKQDASTVSQIVKRWIKQNNRWNSPKYLLGESYGTTRAAAMLPFLDSDDSPLHFNGLVLISQALDYTGSTPTNDNIIANVTYLPTMAATAWYHGKSAYQAEKLATLITQVKKFAVERYLPALFQGTALSSKEFNAVAEQLAGFIGVDVNYVKRAKLRINAWRHLKELSRDKNLITGSFDSRYQAADLDTFGLTGKFDAASEAISSAFTAALNDYLRADLKVDWQRDYMISGSQVSKNWVYYRNTAGKEPKYVNTANDLALEMKKNPHMKVMLASGYFDYATPFFDAEYTLNRHDIDINRIKMTHYQSGHMIYLHQPSLKKLAADLRKFYQAN